jgi:hypothetical protein
MSLIDFSFSAVAPFLMHPTINNNMHKIILYTTFLLLSIPLIYLLTFDVQKGKDLFRGGTPITQGNNPKK